MNDFEVLKKVINEEWDRLYPESKPVDDVFALSKRVKNIAEDRNCWVFNAKVLQKEPNKLEEGDMATRYKKRLTMWWRHYGWFCVWCVSVCLGAAIINVLVGGNLYALLF